MFQGEDSSPPPSPTKRRHGTVVGPLIPPDVTRTLPQFIFSSQESTNRNSYHSLGAATGNRPSDGGVRPNEGTMQGPSSRPSQGHATLSEKCVSKPNGGHLAEMHPRNGPKQNAKGAALGISPLDRPHEGKGPGAQPANGPSVTQSQIIVAPSTPTVTDMTDNDISTRDCIDLPERFRGTRFRKPVVREEIDSVSELRERERDLTTAIDWIRQEISRTSTIVNMSASAGNSTAEDGPGKTLQAIKYERGTLEILDQRILPHETKYVKVETAQDGWEAIREMKVRGAPAIAITGCLSIAIELDKAENQFKSKEELCAFVKSKLDYLITSRPTAVNMKDAATTVMSWLQAVAGDDKKSADDVKLLLIEFIEKMLEDDVQCNRTLGRIGADDILSRFNQKPVNVMTHCNTGSLATAGYGTALGVIRSLFERGKLHHAYCTETRPYHQGSRLTAFELVYEQIPGTLICDSMAAILMKKRDIAAVVVGADRVVANGDTANKIGTYQLAVLAKYHDVPFYVIAPSTSVDLSMRTGDEIQIEERPAEELVHIKGIKIAADGINVWNPAFDVTPAKLITGGIVTEYGLFKPEEMEEQLLAAKKKLELAMASELSACLFTNIPGVSKIKKLKLMTK